jgi:CheY-like chemotaxis protein/HPt (histidine-containing phosphotransfer) domain-containing protein
MRTGKCLVFLCGVMPTMVCAAPTVDSGATPGIYWWLVTLASLVLVIVIGVVLHFLSKIKNTRTLLGQMKKVDTLKDEFLASTSQGLRAPLNAIIGLTESLIDGVAGQLPTAVRQNLSLVVASGLQLNHLVNDIMDFSKIKNGQLVLDLKAIDVRAMVDVVMALASHMLGDKALNLVNAVPPGLPTVQADEQRLQQILHNLVGSAVKFTDSGHVTVCAMLLGDKMRVMVTDSGNGMSAQQIERLFDAFEHTENSEPMSRGSSSRGLSVTKQLVTLHGGEIEVKSEEGTGSTFAFTIPIDGAGAINTKPQSHDGAGFDPCMIESDIAAPQGSADRSNKRFRLLLVDDEKINRQVLLNYLTLAHYQLVEAANGPEALHAMENDGPFDLVLLDIMMPGMSGYEVCQKIRERFAFSELPILFLTAKNQILDLVHSFDVGGSDYLTKPVSKFELLARIKTQLTQLETIRNLQARLNEQSKALQRAEDIQSEQTVDAIITPDLTGFDILLVDDNIIDRSLTEALLTDTGAGVTLLQDGQAAVDTLRERVFDLVLMDIEMPILGGMAATQAIRNTLALEDLPIIALTTHAMVNQRERFKAAGMNDHIAKPLEKHLLYQLLNRYLIENTQQSRSSSKEIQVAVGTPKPGCFINKVAEIEGLDTATALAKMNGKTGLYLSMIKAFVSAKHTRGETLIELFEQQDWGELYRNVHSLKSNAAYIGAYGVSDLSAAVITAYGEGHYERQLLEPLCLVLHALMTRLDSIIGLAEDEVPVTTAASGTGDGDRSSILIIEDSSQMQLFLKSVLADEYLVYVADDGEEGITMAREKMPDIIISDLVMPGKSGYEVCNTLKSDDTTCHIPFMLLTAKTDRESRIQGWRELADEYLTKPCDEEELKLRIVNLLGIRHALKQRFGQVLNQTRDVLPQVASEYSERDQLFLQRFTVLIEGRCADADLKISHVASELALTVRTLQNKLNALTDNNFTEYLAKTRMVKAKGLLRQGKKVADVTWETGFTEHTYFSKFFKEHAGETPTQFRRRECDIPK